MRLSMSELVMGFVPAVITPSYTTVVPRIARGFDVLVLLRYPHMWIQDGRQLTGFAPKLAKLH